MEQNIFIDSAVLGTIVSIALQALKLLPERWLQKVLTMSPKYQKLRMQAIVFTVTLLCVLVQAAHLQMFQWDSLYQIFGMLAVAITTAYGTYQSIIRTIADKFPEYFRLSE